MDPLIKLEGPSGPRYLLWSCVWDAPASRGLTLEELREHLRTEGGQQALDDLLARLARLDVTGTSIRDTTLESVVACNRAGPDETNLTIEELWQQYCM